MVPCGGTATSVLFLSEVDGCCGAVPAYMSSIVLASYALAVKCVLDVLSIPMLFWQAPPRLIQMPESTPRAQPERFADAVVRIVSIQRLQIQRELSQYRGQRHLPSPESGNRGVEHSSSAPETTVQTQDAPEGAQL